ncbi:MAG: hypothetical protein HC853_13495 [Anaerolineae bacterium]|nr:hypothetical protein [Anaerolineae bacterium]
MNTIIQELVNLHGLWRWVVALVAIVALVKFLMGWFGNKQVTSQDKMIGTAFSSVMSIQFVVGLINLIGYFAIGAFNPRVHMEHAVYGLVAVGLSHALPLRKDDRPDVARFRTSAIMIIVALVLTVLSVLRLRGGWVWG